jgi:hypothetical protein
MCDTAPLYRSMYVADVPLSPAVLLSVLSVTGSCSCRSAPRSVLAALQAPGGVGLGEGEGDSEGGGDGRGDIGGTPGYDPVSLSSPGPRLSSEPLMYGTVFGLEMPAVAGSLTSVFSTWPADVSSSAPADCALSVWQSRIPATGEQANFTRARPSAGSSVMGA